MTDPHVSEGAPDLSGAPSAPPTWRRSLLEYGWPLEHARLFADPVWRGRGVASGEGRPVLLIPGFMAGDASLRVMTRWLQARGYRAHLSGIRWNVGCADRILDGLRPRLQRLQDETGEQVSIVGHSRGGLLGNALAGLHPDLVRRVVTLGSPLADNFAISPMTGLAVAGARHLEYARFPASRRRGCFTGACVCSYTEGTQAQESRAVPLTCIVTPDDGVVTPSACMVPGATIVQVRGTHVGLAWNPQVYRILGEVLPS